jgi:hypothetical protein
LKRIDARTRQKVIELYKEGKEIKEITQILNNTNIKISYGSTWNIVQDSRSQSEPSNQVDQSPLLKSTIPDDLMRDHSSAVDSKCGPTGCPLSRFIPQEEISDLEDSKEKKAINYNQPTKNTITNDPCMEDIDILDADSEPDIYTDPNADYDERYDGDGPFVRTVNRYPNIPSRRLQIPGTRYNNYSHAIKDTSEEESDQASNSLGMDWDENHEAMFVKWVLNQKRIRQQEEQKLEEERAMLYQERCSIEDQKRVLEAREAKLSEVKDLIPSAAELKSMGVEFTHAIAWINVIREYASKKMVDERTATWRLAEDLKNWQELGGLENAIQNAKNQLALLNMTLEDQKAAISTLVNLQKMGMSEIEISRLVKLVNGWGKGNGLELDSRLNLQNTPQ